MWRAQRSVKTPRKLWGFDSLPAHQSETDGPPAVWRDELDVAGWGGGQRPVPHIRHAEVRAVDVDVAARVHDDLVRALLGVGGHRPVVLLAPQLVAGHQQSAV